MELSYFKILISILALIFCFFIGLLQQPKVMNISELQKVKPKGKWFHYRDVIMTCVGRKINSAQKKRKIDPCCLVCGRASHVIGFRYCSQEKTLGRFKNEHCSYISYRAISKPVMVSHSSYPISHFLSLGLQIA